MVEDQGDHSGSGGCAFGEVEIRQLYRGSVVGNGEVGCGEVGDEVVLLVADDEVERDLGDVALEVRCCRLRRVGGGGA